MADIQPLITALMTADPAERPISTLDQAQQAWWRHWQADHDAFGAALRSGFDADRLAWAFVAGYQSALRALFSHLVDCPDSISLSISEQGGNRPRDIHTRLSSDSDGYRLDGHKQWATMSDRASRLLVAARLNAPQAERAELKLLDLSADLPGITREPMPPTAFTPEIAHCRIHFEDVRVEKSSILPGDGYSAYIKPFRFHEDCQVNAALAGYLLRLGRLHDWPRDTLLDLLGLISLLWQAASLPVDAPLAHLLYEQASRRLAPLADPDAAHWQLVDDAAARRWRRDIPLSGIAATARKIRLERAWSQLSPAR